MGLAGKLKFYSCRLRDNCEILARKKSDNLGGGNFSTRKLGEEEGELYGRAPTNACLLWS